MISELLTYKFIYYVSIIRFDFENGTNDKITGDFDKTKAFTISGISIDKDLETTTSKIQIAVASFIIL